MTNTELMPIVMQPDKTSSYPGATLLNLAKIFPQIGLSGTESLNRIEEEINDFILSQK